MSLRIADLPFCERPLLELLHLDDDRDLPDPTYAGFGWARADRVWLAGADGEACAVDRALVLALHSADDSEVLPDDIELEFELADRPITVLASMFLERWLPRLPRDAGAIVLAMCNPHRARLRPPVNATLPVHYAVGDVTSWIDPAGPGDPQGRIRLAADTWYMLSTQEGS